MKTVPIYIVFESSIFKKQSSKDFIKRIIGHFRTDPFALSEFQLEIISYDIEAIVVRELSPIDLEWEIDNNNLLCSFYDGESDFDKLVDTLSTELSMLNYKEHYSPIVYLITDCQDETGFYKGFSELHARHKDLEICHINLRQMPRADRLINIDSLDNIDSIGYNLSYDEGYLDCYYPKTKIVFKQEVISHEVESGDTTSPGSLPPPPTDVIIVI